MTDVSQRFNKEVYQIAVSLIRKFDERYLVYQIF